MIHAPALAESIVAPTLFRPEFLHSLDPEEKSGVPEGTKHWSTITLREKLIKIGAKVMHHSRYITFQMAEVAIPRHLFAAILRLIDDLRPSALPP
jgi:hypothetical protein